ncbi:response regulator transcription factor [Evansella cellulosilytica]|uniref:Two component transcriptional regulator, AraC family n=1 Tax=Evansella cellulosilytica (strain ATCC 21833 / DSM 2522 / FERM P-1141 / JCM 9156 / N-4) TaxID=649639 RepID=E6TXL0_EVAC2|nr:response regulator transcription factor [Evansella cellulosilytica]ADU28824.1 two component transcriptional regulator, AraC family [Evansella cellulosilytica DSM 2522]
MYKVLLVDDEVFVRKGLRSLIEWEKCGYDVVSEADDGEDAFEVIKQISPDVVITDIKMPIVDGLELIKKVRETLDHDTKFIIISGYNDFSYAQRAVKYGVVDFVLKPIDKEEFEGILTDLHRRLEMERTARKAKDKLYLSQLIVNVFDEAVKEGEISKWSRALKMDQSQFFYYVIFEKNNVTPNKVTPDKERKCLSNIIVDALSDIEKNNQPLAIYEHEENAIGILIAAHHLIEFDHDIVQFVSRISKEVNRKANQPITAFIGTKVSKLFSIKHSYETANRIRSYKYIVEDKDVISYENVMNIPITFNDINKSLYVKLIEQMEEKNINELEKVIALIFSEFQSRRFAPWAIRTSINRCVHGIIETINSMDGNVKSMSTIEAMTNWEKYHLTLDELKKVFREFIIEGTDMIQELRKENMKGDIYKVKAYVESNYHKNISLKSIARQFYMNPVYMGQLFKKTFGMYFKEFVLKLRMDEAKKLLRQTDMLVYEIAENVGFGSTDYFVTQFEKKCKMTPTEYRNELLKK